MILLMWLVLYWIGLVDSGWWLLGVTLLEVLGFCFVFYAHVKMMGNVELPYVILRSVLWPIYLATGRP